MLTTLLFEKVLPDPFPTWRSCIKLQCLTVCTHSMIDLHWSRPLLGMCQSLFKGQFESNIAAFHIWEFLPYTQDHTWWYYNPDLSA